MTYLHTHYSLTGHTQSLVDISPYKWYQAVDGKNYKPSTTHVAALPDAFRGKYRCVGEATEEVGALYACDVAKMVENIGGTLSFLYACSPRTNSIILKVSVPLSLNQLLGVVVK